MTQLQRMIRIQTMQFLTTRKQEQLTLLIQTQKVRTMHNLTRTLRITLHMKTRMTEWTNRMNCQKPTGRTQMMTRTTTLKTKIMKTIQNIQNLRKTRRIRCRTTMILPTKTLQKEETKSKMLQMLKMQVQKTKLQMKKKIMKRKR